MAHGVYDTGITDHTALQSGLGAPTTTSGVSRMCEGGLEGLKTEVP